MREPYQRHGYGAKVARHGLCHLQSCDGRLGQERQLLGYSRGGKGGVHQMADGLAARGAGVKGVSAQGSIGALQKRPLSRRGAGQRSRVSGRARSSKEGRAADPHEARWDDGHSYGFLQSKSYI